MYSTPDWGKGGHDQIGVASRQTSQSLWVSQTMPRLVHYRISMKRPEDGSS